MERVKVGQIRLLRVEKLLRKWRKGVKGKAASELGNRLSGGMKLLAVKGVNEEEANEMENICNLDA